MVSENQTTNQDKTQLHKEIEQWILESLSKSHPAFNNFPPCPYAKEALLKNKITIHTIEGDAKEFILNAVENFESYKVEVLVLVDEKNSLTKNQTQELVKEVREILTPINYWLMYDHPAVEEMVSDFDVSFNKAPLFFLQKLDMLCKKADELEKTGYYKNWDPEYYTRVVTKRKQLLKKRDE